MILYGQKRLPRGTDVRGVADFSTLVICNISNIDAWVDLSRSILNLAHHEVLVIASASSMNMIKIGHIAQVCMFESLLPSHSHVLTTVHL